MSTAAFHALSRPLSRGSRHLDAREWGPAKHDPDHPFHLDAAVDGAMLAKRGLPVDRGDFSERGHGHDDAHPTAHKTLNGFRV